MKGFSLVLPWCQSTIMSTMGPASTTTVTVGPTAAHIPSTTTVTFKFNAMYKGHMQAPLKEKAATAGLHLLAQGKGWDGVERYVHPDAMSMRMAMGTDSSGNPATLNMHKFFDNAGDHPWGWLNIGVSKVLGRGEHTPDFDSASTLSVAPFDQIIRECGGYGAPDVSGSIEMPDGRRYELYGEDWTQEDQDDFFLPPPPPPPPAPSPDRLTFAASRLHCYNSGQMIHRRKMIHDVDAFCSKHAGETIYPDGRIKEQTNHYPGILKIFIQTEIWATAGAHWTIDERFCKAKFRNIIDSCDSSGVKQKQGGWMVLDNIHFRVDPQAYRRDP
ncbi:hypothetical protein MPH_00522 [Macrophomina phaseolina MS6]|uniref:Uncharacterized protein n=1 Tax=Macrophomina phaseolina (strain MS6) TaxID=1126212 RepID=K2SI88_MACPH|nr:hypothetical protein MPH_00522 [Macrophomina phaseolina MS6]